MSESTNQNPSALSDTQDVYSSPYEEVNGCLCKVHITKQGNFYVRLCNFAPKIVSELTIDDGTELTRKYRIGGVDEYGRPLPEFEIDATELEKMDWLHNHLDASLDLEIIPQVEKHVRHAMKSTARFATKKSIFTFTGWKQVDGEWEYLMPGVGAYDVQLQGKQKWYFLDADVKDFDYAELAGFFRLDLIPMEITYPCLALVFLSPLNEFLRQIGHEPKFILTLLGRTGSMKSTESSTARTNMKRKNGCRDQWATATNMLTLSSASSMLRAICSENFVMKASVIYSMPSVTVASLPPIRSANILWTVRT